MANEVQLIIGAATDVGRERQVNEDSHGFVHCAAGDLLMVCDGMGGHAQGDLASRTARDAISAYVATYAASLPPRDLLERATLHAHEAVRTVAAQSQANTGMGTTCVLALIQNGQLWVSNVGDSRCYLVRGSAIRQLSVDHTKARKLLDAGIITAEQFATHPEKGVLAQALGQRAAPQPFVSEPVPLAWNDYVVLCSDGVYDSTERDMADLTSANNPNYGAHNLVIEAVKRDGKDNATVVIGRYADMNASAPAAAPQKTIIGAAVAPAAPWKQPVVLAGLGGAVLVGALAGLLLGSACKGNQPPHENPPPASNVADVGAVPAEEDAGSESAVDVIGDVDVLDAKDPRKPKTAPLTVPANAGGQSGQQHVDPPAQRKKDKVDEQARAAPGAARAATPTGR